MRSYARRVFHSTWKTRSYSPHSGDTFDAQRRLGTARLARSPRRSRSPRARIARRAAAGADSLDIYMHTRYHSGEQSTRGTRAKRVSPRALLLRSGERKEQERERERLRSVSAHLRSSTRDFGRRGANSRGLPVPTINSNRSRSFVASRAMTSPLANGRRKHVVESPRWTSGS